MHGSFKHCILKYCKKLQKKRRIPFSLSTYYYYLLFLQYDNKQAEMV